MPQNTRHNLSSAERKTIRDLKNQTDWIIKPADKGSGTVLWERGLYITEAQRQLDSNNYLKLEHSRLKQTCQNIENALNNLIRQGLITLSDKNAMTQSDPREADFYLLSKIHKNKTNPPGRPILSGNGHPTEWVSAWVDHHIQPLMLKLPTYLRDTTDLLNHIKSIKPTGNTRILSLDVTSLYTNIPQDLGVNSIRTVGAILDPDTDYSAAATLAKVVLENKIFKFNGDHYIQTQGTAMGTRMAPAYANIFMYTIEEKIINQLPEIILWRRFIDDIICVFEQNEICDHNYILEIANDIIPEIQFTLETVDGKQVNFLDTTLTVTPDEITSSPYIKPTDKRLYVRMDSCHLLHQKTSIAHSQCLRLRRICSSIDQYCIHSLRLRDDMIKRGYSAPPIDATIKQVKDMDRKKLLQPARKTSAAVNTTTIYCVTTYHPGTKNIKKIIENYTRDMNIDIIVSLKKKKNLQDILVRACIEIKEDIRDETHNLNIREAEMDLDRNYCVSCHPLSTGRAILTKSPDTKPGYRSVQKCKQMHNKYAIYCHICKTPELYCELTSPHQLIRRLRANKLKLEPHPHHRDCLNITIYPVWSKNIITIGCSECRFSFKNHIDRMPETISYEITTLINSLQSGLFTNTRSTPHENWTLCADHPRTGITLDGTNYYTKQGNCKSSGLVYGIECNNCYKIYVGQTKNKLRIRLLQHNRDIRRANPIRSVANHFNESCPGANWTFKILEYEDDTFKRLVKEKSWIHILDSENPNFGINKESESHYALSITAQNTYRHYQHSATCKPRIDHRIL